MSGTDTLRRVHFTLAPKLPMVYQAEQGECGLACLAMVAGYYQRPQTMAALRSRFPSSTRGISLAGLMKIAEDLGIQCRALRLDLEQLPALSTPCILHWDMDHYVVLKGVRRGALLLHDPDQGPVKMSMQEASAHFTGVALETMPVHEYTPPQQQERARGLTLTGMWERITGIGSNLAMLLVLSLLLQLFALAAPFYMQTVVDDVVVRADTGLLLTLALGFGLLLLIQTGTGLLRSFIVLHLATRLHLQLAANLLHHLIRLPLDYFASRHLGDTLSRFASTDAIRQVLSSNLVSAVVDGLLACLTLVAMLVYDVWLTLLVVAVLCVSIAISLALYRPMRNATEQGIRADALCETSLLETLRGIQAVKLLQAESRRHDSWQQKMADSLNCGIRLSRLEIGAETAQGLLFGLENLLVVYLAALSIIDGSMTVGMLFAFVAYKGRFTDAVQGLVDNLLSLRMLSVHLDRLADIVLTEKEPTPAPPATPHRCRQPCQLEVRGLGYRFPGESRPLIKDLNFVVEPGELVVITGPSGVGKSTLLKCLLGLLRFEGSLLIDNRPTNPIDYRARLAAVMQDDQVMEGSIAENICGFDEHPDNNRMLECARLAAIHEDIMLMPQQYHTRVGDGGAGFSGGQLQRVLLARALYREPDILFLDEATCHLDVATESSVIDALAGLSITRIVVAHRPETIALADRVITLAPPSAAE